MYGCAVNDRFKDRTDLPGSFNLIVLEIFVIQSADPGFYLSSMRFYGDESGM